jgi:hypothetical protein
MNKDSLKVTESGKPLFHGDLHLKQKPQTNYSRWWFKTNRHKVEPN